MGTVLLLLAFAVFGAGLLAVLAALGPKSAGEVHDPEPDDEAALRWLSAHPSACCCLVHSTTCCQVHGVRP